MSKELIEKAPSCCVQRREPLILKDLTCGDDDATLCTLSSSSSTLGRRRVAFHTDEEGKIATTEYDGLALLTAEEREKCWYRNSEFKYFRKYGKKLATIAAASKYGKDFEKTVSACARGEKELDKYSKIANSSARGLEVLVLPQLQKDRKGTIRSVLLAQSKFTDDMAADRRAEILCATSFILSRQSKLMARVLAKGDANIVTTMQKEGPALGE